MSFLIEDAWAQASGSQGGGFALIPFILLFVVFYFFLIRPQTKRVKEHKQMVAALQKGDEVVTNGGLLGKITSIGDNFVVLEISQGTEVKVQRQAVGSVMPKGTMKTL